MNAMKPYNEIFQRHLRCKQCGKAIARFVTTFINIAHGSSFYFCKLDCKREWIYKQSRKEENK